MRFSLVLTKRCSPSTTTTAIRLKIAQSRAETTGKLSPLLQYQCQEDDEVRGTEYIISTGNSVLHMKLRFTGTAIDGWLFRPI